MKSSISSLYSLISTLPSPVSLVVLVLVLVACGGQVETRTSAIDGKVMVRVPGGAFKIGTSDALAQELTEQYQTTGGALKGEQPEQTIQLPDFWIDQNLVTNAEYKKFLDANPNQAVPALDLDAVRPWNWDAGTRTFPAGRENYPVVLVTWDDAIAYCKWAGKRLPTEAEWEKAARGTDGRLYPWGNAWDETKTTVGKIGAKDASPVGQFPGGASPYGAYDMVGNVWQWTSSLDQSYPYVATDGREDLKGAGKRITRGGMYAFGPGISRTNIRNAIDPQSRAISVGLRCAQ